MKGHYRDKINSIVNAVAVIDRDYTIIGTNREFEQLSGYKKEELEGKISLTSFVRTVDIEDCLKTSHRSERQSKEPREECELQFTTREGKKVSSLMRMNLIRGTVFGIVSFIDVNAFIKKEELVEYRLKLEKLIADISQKFINASRRELNEAIDYSLMTVGSFMNVDRSYLFQFSEDGLTMTNTHEWCAPGVTPQIELLKDLSVEIFTWIIQELKEGHNVNIASLEDLPPEAAPEKEILAAQEIQSLAIVPLIHTGLLKGYMGFDSTKKKVLWKDENFFLLRTIGDTIISGIMQQRLHRQVFYSQKMEAVGRLAGGIAHDFNNILTTIRGHIQLLPYTDTISEEGANIINTITEATNSGADLTRRLLAISNNQTIALEPVNLHSIIENSKNIFSRVIPDTITLHTRLEAENDIIQAMPSQIEQIILNLVINSADAMPNGGTLLIKTREIKPSETVIVQESNLPRGNYIQLQVSDSGHGMDEQTMEKAMEPFFTTKEDGKGSGMGLSTVYAIVEQYGGLIQIDSAPKKGTSIDIYLPQLPSSEG